MLGFDTMQRFFNDPQDELRAELAARGFVINDDAMIHAGYTWPAVTAMLSPNFYDNYFGQLLAETNHLIRGEDRQNTLFRSISRDIGNNVRIWGYTELFSAFREVGYKIIMQTHPGTGFSPFASDVFYNIRLENSEVMINRRSEDARLSFFVHLGDLRSLLFDNTPLPVFWNQLMGFELVAIDFAMSETDTSLGMRHVHRVWHTHMLFEVLIHALENSSSPRFIITTPYITHYTMWDDDIPLGDAYADNHFIAAHVMLQLIDIILHDNPNAVIVLQGDHGFHADWVLDELRDGGMNDADLFELAHSTISAVRIPEIYGGLDAPIAPINIARELMNRFVGRNYEVAIPHVNPMR
jgi:hypothetical protein